MPLTSLCYKKNIRVNAVDNSRMKAIIRVNAVDNSSMKTITRVNAADNAKMKTHICVFTASIYAATKNIDCIMTENRVKKNNNAVIKKNICCHTAINLIQATQHPANYPSSIL